MQHFINTDTFSDIKENMPACCHEMTLTISLSRVPLSFTLTKSGYFNNLKCNNEIGKQETNISRIQRVFVL